MNRPALYWVIKFETGGYDHPDSLPGSSKVMRAWHRGDAFRWSDLVAANSEACDYRAIGIPCRVVRVVRKVPR
jgi:hypothetical protein